jgi:glycosyltransferase involved in cell wall biosynthesis
MNISVIVPLFNEEESLPELQAWIKKVMDENHYTYEILFIDDGSKDTSWKVIEQLAKENTNVKGIKFRRNYGKAAALNTGFVACRGEVVITMDADLQDSPEEIPELYNMIVRDGYDLVSGWKQKRFDPLTKTIPTKIYNSATRRLSGIKLHDMNCGLKSYKSDVVKSIEVYGEMHRYIPVIAKWSGFTKIGEKVVQHQERKYGSSKFGLERFVNGFLDLMSITFVGRFGRKPMHFFGLIGTIMFIIGFSAAAYLGFNKLYLMYTTDIKPPLVTSNPWFFISLTTMILGTMLFLTGFMAEMIARNAPNRNHYVIEKEI